MKKLILVIIVLALAGGAAYTYSQRTARPVSAFRTVPLKRGDLSVMIGATGTVEPVEVVDVGAQVGGKINTFGADPDGSGKSIDYGSAVEEGTILAQIDDALYQSDADQASAQLEQTKANVLRSTADLEQMKAKLFQAEQNWKRAQELGPSRALSATDYDSYRAAYESAKATVAVGEATIVQSEKAVLQAEASLKRVQINLSYCTIRSPVKGVIVDRRVNIGQTVVSSLNAPSLFLIAKDLRRLQVWASVNEADIGRIHSGQPVRFTVDAYSGTTFSGEVGKVRLNASMTQNVVTYTVEINTDNSDGKLLPYLTANVQFEVAQRKDVMLAPNAALRWTPQPQQIAPDARQASAGREQRRSDPPGAAERQSAPRPGPVRHSVWVVDGDFVRPLAVREGLSDGALTEIEGDDLQEGRGIVIGEMARGAGGDDSTRNPFTPQLFGGRRQ